MSTSAGRVLMIPKGDYDAEETYTMLDVVSYQGKSYVAKQTTTGNAPTNTTYWQLMIDAQGHSIKDSTTTFPYRANLVFGDGLTVSDDPTNNATRIEIPFDYSSITWANGTQEELAKMLQDHYDGKIDIHDYWAVGDEREVNLESLGYGSQTITMVLLNSGGKTLSDGITECAFVVGLKNVLSVNDTKPMNSSGTNIGGWRDCTARTWCNGTFKDALPSDIKDLFKQFKNNSGQGGGSTSGVYETIDYFALPAEIEVQGTTTNSVSGEGSQFEYYETAANRIKYNHGASTGRKYWMRSPYNANDLSFCLTWTDGTIRTDSAVNYNYMAPFGCI